jgi:hypothetical protein
MHYAERRKLRVMTIRILFFLRLCQSRASGPEAAGVYLLPVLPRGDGEQAAGPATHRPDVEAEPAVLLGPGAAGAWVPRGPS